MSELTSNSTDGSERIDIMPKLVIGNVHLIAGNDTDRIFPSKQGAKSGRQRVEGKFRRLVRQG